MEEASVYIHVPYCKSKCRYCNFNSYPGREDEFGNYVNALLAELELRSQHLSAAVVPTVFFGGGTPTVIGAEMLGAILDRCPAEAGLAVSPEAEISIEANPETVSPPLLDALLAAGFNRISLGVQSFSDTALRRLGRIHSGAQAALAVRQAAEAGFRNISVDLMFGIPAQDIAGWEEDLEAALSLRPQHISAYGLAVEEKTPFARLLKLGLISLPDEEACCKMYSAAVEKLARAGYEHYEISNFALPGYRCRHNVNYWRNGSYLGLGAGAHSYLDGERSANVDDPGRYIAMAANAGSAVRFHEKLAPRAALGEALMLGLRLLEGIDMEEYTGRYGVDFQQEFGGTVAELVCQGFMEMEGGRLKLTRRGVLLSDEVFQKFL